MLMFGSRESIDLLRSSPDWFMDGTFDTVPPQFTQMYTIHGLDRGRNVIGIYALLQDETQWAYERMLHHVSFLTGGTVPNSVNIYFERAAINAVSTRLSKFAYVRLFLPFIGEYIQESARKWSFKSVHARPGLS